MKKFILNFITGFMIVVSFLSVVNVVALAGVPVVESTIYVAVGHSKSIPCSIANCQGNRKTWNGSSSCFKISTSGTVTGINVGSGKVTVSTGIEGESAECTVVVCPPAQISVNETNISLYKDDNYLIYSSISPSNACKKLIWSSSNNNVVSVDSSGNIYAIGIGSAVVSCKTDDGGSGKADIVITVSNKPQKSTAQSTKKTSEKSTTKSHTTKKITTTKKKKTTTKKHTTQKKTSETTEETKKNKEKSTTTTTKATTTKKKYYISTSNYTPIKKSTHPTSENNPEDYLSGVFRDYELKSESKRNKPIVLTWNDFEDADGYELCCSTNGLEFYVIYDGTQCCYEQHHFRNGEYYYYFLRSYTIVNGIKNYDNNSYVIKQKTVWNNLFQKIF